jgi:hypothetical protein
MILPLQHGHKRERSTERDIPPHEVEKLWCRTAADATALEDPSTVRASYAGSARNPAEAVGRKPRPRSCGSDVAITQIRGLLGGELILALQGGQPVLGKSRHPDIVRGSSRSRSAPMVPKRLEMRLEMRLEAAC